MGSQEEGGDAYPYRDKARSQQYELLDRRNQCYKKGNDVKALELTDQAWSLDKNKKETNEGIDFGAWRGNDTIWRTVLDINRAITYADRQGEIMNYPQRKIISIGDMIVCGENEGPLAPDYKKVGGILFADDSVEFDLFLCELMGFDYKKIPVLYQALLKNNLALPFFCSSTIQFCGEKIDKENSFSFVAQKGWRGFIEREN